jgi:hypothetical protein
MSNVRGRGIRLPYSSKFLKSGSRPFSSVVVPSSVVVLALKTGDIVVDELGGRGVVADDDKDRRHGDAGLLPQLEGFPVVAVERLKRR